MARTSLLRKPTFKQWQYAYTHTSHSKTRFFPLFLNFWIHNIYYQCIYDFSFFFILSLLWVYDACVYGCRHTCGQEPEDNFWKSVHSWTWAHIAGVLNSWDISMATSLFYFFLKRKSYSERQENKNAKKSQECHSVVKYLHSISQGLDSISTNWGEGKQSTFKLIFNTFFYIRVENTRVKPLKLDEENN